MDGPNLEGYNLRSPAVKRILREAKELNDSTFEYYARPLEDNLFEWHFTVRGAPDSDFSGGFYHGRIILPTEYPMKPPSIILLTPNGRFELNQKICLNISGHHPETWMPSWSIRTALLALISFMPTNPKGHLGAVSYPPEERRKLARQSQHWKCDRCGLIRDHLKTTPDNIPAEIPPSPAPTSQENGQEMLQQQQQTPVEPVEQEREIEQQPATDIQRRFQLEGSLPILLSIAGAIFALILRRLLITYL